MADFTYNQSTPNGTTLITLEPSGGVGYTYALDINQAGTLAAIEVDATGAVKVADNSKLPTTGMNFYGIVKEDSTCTSVDIPIEGEFIATQVVTDYYLRESTCLVSEGGCAGESHGDWAGVKTLFSTTTLLNRTAGWQANSQLAYGETATQQNHVINIPLVSVSGGSYTSFEVFVGRYTYGPSLSHECRVVVSNTAPTAGDDLKGWSSALDLGDPKAGSSSVKTIDVSSIDTTQEFWIAIVPTPWWDGTLTNQLFDNNHWSIIDAIIS